MGCIDCVLVVDKRKSPQHHRRSQSHSHSFIGRQTSEVFTVYRQQHTHNAQLSEPQIPLTPLLRVIRFLLSSLGPQHCRSRTSSYSRGFGCAMEDPSAPGSTCPSRSDAAAALPALQQNASPFEFEDVDCKANRPHKASPAPQTGSGSLSTGAVGDLLGDSVQSPLPAIKETGEIMAVSSGVGTSL